jgi:hypothetical protein
LNRRGSVLLHVLVTSVLVAVISATLLRMALFRYQMAGRGASVLQEKRDDQAALASVIGTWNAANKVCSGAPAGWTGCTNPGTCACTCTRPAAVGPPVIDKVVVTASNTGPAASPCVVSIASVDLSPPP